MEHFDGTIKKLAQHKMLFLTNISGQILLNYYFFYDYFCFLFLLMIFLNTQLFKIILAVILIYLSIDTLKYSHMKNTYN